MGIKPPDSGGAMTAKRSTAVLEVSGVQWATSKNVAEAVLSRRPGVLGVEANPVAQTATVIYDPSRTSVAELAGWVRDCGYHCAGQSVPEHICDPLAEPPTAAGDMHDHPQTTNHAHTDHGSSHRHTDQGARHDHVITDAPTEPSTTIPVPHVDHAAHSPVTPHEAMGHGGHHAGTSMDDMVRDMRNRFIVAALLSIPILLWSPIGREVIGFNVPAPFGLRDDVSP
jgi:Cu2+-exporting ATPase